MKSRAAVVNKIEKTPHILVPAQTREAVPDPWKQTPRRNPISETADAVTQAFGTVLTTSQAASEAQANAAENAGRAAQYLSTTQEMVSRSQEQTDLPADAKQMDYAQIARDHASLAESEAKAATFQQAIAFTALGQASTAAKLMSACAEGLPPQYDNAVRLLKGKAYSTISEAKDKVEQAARHAAKAHRAAENALNAVKNL